MIGFLIGLVVGAGAGFFVAALLAVASESDDRAERHLRVVRDDDES